jgi:putative NADPH-quinone reductase
MTNNGGRISRGPQAGMFQTRVGICVWRQSPASCTVTALPPERAMSQRICVIAGHPDPAPAHFVSALAQAYADGARASGREVRTIAIGELQFPIIRSAEDWNDGAVPEDIVHAQESIRQADHLVVIFPLWLGAMPALLKGFLEQVMRPGFALAKDSPTPWSGQLKGRSARIIVTMGMPALFYRWVYRAHSLRSLERNILRFVGFRPVRSTVIGMVERSAEHRKAWLARVDALGRAGR